MRPVGRVMFCLALAAGMLLPASAVLAGKSMDVIARSNGFPSGAHLNLNIHGKQDGFAADTTSGGGSVFVPEYGVSTVSYVSNKRGSIAELTVLDNCGEAFDGDPALVQLPYETQGYYVFARILGKPGNSAVPGDPSSILLVPNPVLEVCNDDPANPDPNFGDYTDCDTIEYDLIANGGNGNGFIDQAEMDNWLAAQAELGLATYYDHEWVFNVADLVIQDQTVINDGTKLLQIRFYPVATTQFSR